MKKVVPEILLRDDLLGNKRGAGERNAYKSWRKAAVELIFKEPLNKFGAGALWQNRDDHKARRRSLSTVPGSATPRVIDGAPSSSCTVLYSPFRLPERLNHFSSASLTYR
jgi:hypothetical protein